MEDFKLSDFVKEKHETEARLADIFTQLLSKCPIKEIEMYLHKGKNERGTIVFVSPELTIKF